MNRSPALDFTLPVNAPLATFAKSLNPPFKTYSV
jgi:hypothetical protein